MTTTPHLGIAITTRNRPKMLKLCLEHFAHFRRKHFVRMVIVDDSSDEHNALSNEALARRFGWTYHYSQERLGVARAKNFALSLVRDCAWIALFEEDCWPIHDHWDDFLIRVAEINGCEALNACHPNGFRLDHIVETCGESGHSLVKVANSTGYLMLWRRDALEALGGYDSRMGICGGEDTQMNLRCHAAGFKPYPYCGPADIGKYFYSFDLDWVWGRTKRMPPLDSEAIKNVEGSSLTGEEKNSGWAAGAQYVHDLQVYKEPTI